MNESLNISFEYKNVKNTPLVFKALAVILILVFAFNPLYELVDVFRREYTGGWCCMLPCPNYYWYYFI